MESRILHRGEPPSEPVKTLLRLESHFFLAALDWTHPRESLYLVGDRTTYSRFGAGLDSPGTPQSGKCCQSQAPPWKDIKDTSAGLCAHTQGTGKRNASVRGPIQVTSFFQPRKPRIPEQRLVSALVVLVNLVNPTRGVTLPSLRANQVVRCVIQQNALSGHFGRIDSVRSENAL